MAIQYFFACLFLFCYVISCIKIMQEKKRGIVLRLGQFRKVVGPGFVFIIQPMDKLIEVDITNIHDATNLPEEILKEKIKQRFFCHAQDPQNRFPK